MSSTKCDFGFSSQNFDQIPFRNKTLYKDTVTKNPFKQTNTDFFTTKISFKDIGMKYSRTEKFFVDKKKMQDERDLKNIAQTNRQLTKSKTGIMNNLMQLHQKLDSKLIYPDQNNFGFQSNFRVNILFNKAKEIRLVDDIDSKLMKNVNNDDLNMSLTTNQKSIIEELKILRESFQFPEKSLTNTKDKNQFRSLLNFKKNEKGSLFITNSRDNLKKKDHEIYDNTTYQNGKRIYFKQPQFNHKRVVVLNPKLSMTKVSLFPQIKVNKFLFNPDVIETKPDIYKSWTIKDIRIFQKCILPRFRNF
jgi:hypothetical protein